MIHVLFAWRALLRRRHAFMNNSGSFDNQFVPVAAHR